MRRNLAANVSHFSKSFLTFAKIRKMPSPFLMTRFSDRHTLLELVDSNYRNARALYTFGIAFYDFPEERLGDACRRVGLPPERVLLALEKASAETTANPQKVLRTYPAGLVIAYLRSVHRVFTRHLLPYMADLIERISPAKFDSPSLAEDLRLVFPLFTQDFIGHIHQEEDTLFSYILRLERAVQEGFHPYTLHLDLSEHSIASMFHSHEKDDDEMEGIRLLTNEYQMDRSTGIYTKVIFSELMHFEKALQDHAHIENHVLFPKAQHLEDRAKNLLSRKAALN